MSLILKKNKSYQGTTLLEILVALLVFALGMMGMIALLLVTHKNSSSSYLKQQAIQSAYNIIERIRANRQAAINGNYNVNNLSTSSSVTIPSMSVDCSATTCSPLQLAQYDTWYWMAKDLTLLPGGCGSITSALAPTGNNTIITVTVQWDDSPAQKLLGANSSTASGNANLAQYVVATLL